MVRPLTTPLLIASALLALGTGAALLVAPLLSTELLLGEVLDSPQSAILARIGGAALLAIGLTCWLERSRDEASVRARLVAGLLIYNLAITALFTEAALAGDMHGPLLWPAIIVHGVLLTWCALLVRSVEVSGAS